VTRFRTEAHLCSWAGLMPAHRESGSPGPGPLSRTGQTRVAYRKPNGRGPNTAIGPLCSVAVVISGLDDDQLIVGRAVEEAVLIIDPPGPEAGQVTAQVFRLPRALKGSPAGLLD
jgi:hypothetical protein